MDILVDPNDLSRNVKYRIRTKGSPDRTNDKFGTFVRIEDTEDGPAAIFKKVSVPFFSGKRYTMTDAEYPIKSFNFYETYTNSLLQHVIKKGTDRVIHTDVRIGGKRKSRKKTLRRKV